MVQKMYGSAVKVSVDKKVGVFVAAKKFPSTDHYFLYFGDPHGLENWLPSIGVYVDEKIDL